MLNRFILFFTFLFSNIVTSDNIDSIKNTESVIYDSIKLNNNHFEKEFQNKYKDNSFIYEVQIPEKNAWDRFKEWLFKLLNNIFSFKNKPKALDNIDVIIKILAGLLIIFVVYLIIKAILNKEGSWIFGKNSQTTINDYTEIEKNIHLIDFKKLIRQAEENKDNRLATRYYYLWVLKKLNEKKIIEWNPEKTNSDYSYEIKNPVLKDNFNYLSYLYNYIWYGEFIITPEIYSNSKKAFEKTLDSI
jgi:hypothetical protein